jgi:hypothetical protein
MKLIAVSMLFSAALFGQTPQGNGSPQPQWSPLLDKLVPPFPQEALKKRFENMTLLNGPAMLWVKPLVTAQAETPKVCAIPLLNALPAKASVDYKIRVVKPNVQDALTARSAQPRIGIPACK